MLRELYTHLKVIHMKLQDKLSDIDQSKLIVGSDEEFSTCKAIDICFPQATRVLRAKRLKDNALNNFRKCLPQPQVNHIIYKLYSPNGILSAETATTFTEMPQELSHTHIHIWHIYNGYLQIWRSICFSPNSNITGYHNNGLIMQYIFYQYSLIPVFQLYIRHF